MLGGDVTQAYIARQFAKKRDSVADEHRNSRDGHLLDHARAQKLLNRNSSVAGGACVPPNVCATLLLRSLERPRLQARGCGAPKRLRATCSKVAHPESLPDRGDRARC